jgi:hypothetical protein
MSETSTVAKATRNASVTQFIFAFLAGFFSVLIFHQGVLALLHATGFTAASPFPMQPTKPFGVPQIWSLAFWGGVWGIVFAIVHRAFPQGSRYWLSTLLFGAVGPTCVAWFVVFPLKGLPLAAGWKLSAMATGLMINGAWGLGTAFFLQNFTLWWSTRCRSTKDSPTTETIS